MGMISKIKGKINNKNNYQKDIEELNRKFNSFTKEYEKTQTSNYNLFNTLFLYYELKPKGLLNDVQQFCIELLDFVDNVCKKHNIDYWIDYGSLLGAIRHEGFIPWDDDMDIGMVRKDFEKFIDIIDEEIKNNGLKGKIRVRKQSKNSAGYIHTFIQLSYRTPSVENPKRKIALSGIDIFSYDFISSYDENVHETFGEAKIKLQEKLKEGIPRREAIKEYISELNVTIDDGDYIIPGMENVRGPKNNYKLSIYDKDMIFPLSQAKLNGKYYPCPNNYDYYLTTLYTKEYSQLPQAVHIHPRLKRLSKYENIDNLFKENLKIIHEKNENFK